MYNVLFLCTANSARSILAEALLNHSAAAKAFRGFSAGSYPKGAVHPVALETLLAHHIPVDGLRSKSWNEFSETGAPKMDFVFTVCDNAAAEQCPLWPGHPITAHWGIPDPAAVTSSAENQRRAFEQAFQTLRRRIDLFTNLPIAELSSRLAVQERVTAIGATPSRS